MARLRTAVLLLAVVSSSFAALGCEEEKPAAPLAPSATALAPSKPAAAGAQKLAVDKAASKLDFMMEAPVEKIRGRVSGATEGELNVDPSDLSKTTGFLAADISALELYQTVQDEKTKEFGKETKNDTQNEHARSWLEIGPDAPEDARKKNSRVEFAIRKIESVTPQSDVTKMTGAQRKVTLKATGDFLLHGRKAEKTAELEATFNYAGDKIESVAVKTVKPFPVGLDQHDVRPREGFGKLASKTLEVLAPKVAKEALVSVDLTFKPGSMPPSSSSAAAPASSASAAASASGAPASGSAAASAAVGKPTSAPKGASSAKP